VVQENSKVPPQAQLNSLLGDYQVGRYGDAEKLAISITQEFPEHDFSVGDIQSSEFIVEQEYDIVIFGQILWYLLEDLNMAVLNAHKLLRPGGHFLISNAFLKEKQRYGPKL